MSGFDDTELVALATALGASGQMVQGLATGIVRKSASDLKSQAQRFAPVDTGNLRQSIITRATGPLESEISSTADYAVYQEYGTRHQPGTPHMRPALEAVEPGFIAAMERLGEQAL